MILGFVATYKYGVFSSKNSKQLRKFVEKLLLNHVAEFAIDSSSYFYIALKNKIVTLPLEVQYKYGQMQATVNFKTDFFSNLPEFYQIYITNSIGSKIFEKNIISGNIENNYISLFLTSIVLYLNNHQVFLYPIIKLYNSGIIIIDFAVYSSDEKLDEKAITDFIIDLRISNFNKIQFNKQLFDFKKISKGKEEIIERDGMAKEYAEYEQGNIESLKDLAIFLVEEIIDKNQTFIAHHNYSIETENISNACIQSLMSGIKYDKIEDFDSIEYKNYREFKNSYKHYVSVSNTITVGETDITRIPSLVIDELFLYMAIKVYQLNSIINSKKKSISDMLDLYKDLINLKGYLINGLSAYYFSKRIFEDLFSEYTLYSKLDNIKELIDIEIRKLEIKKNKYEVNSQNIITIILTLLSSEALLTYIIRPIYLSLNNKNINDLTINENTLLFLIPLVIGFFILLIRKIIRMLS